MFSNSRHCTNPPSTNSIQVACITAKLRRQHSVLTNSRHARIHHPPRGTPVACAQLKHQSKDPMCPALRALTLRTLGRNHTVSAGGHRSAQQGLPSPLITPHMCNISLCLSLPLPHLPRSLSSSPALPLSLCLLKMVRHAHI